MPQSSTPLVEIFIPTYNRASFISQAIDSALGQDYPNVSVVVMDNCSTDNTAEVLARYSDRPNFRVITHERNLGANANFNQCVARRQRDAYFTTLADDDAFLPHFVSTMLKGFSAFPDVDIVGARYLLAQDSLENIVERPQRSNATPRLVPAREIIEDTVLHMGAYMARPGFQMQLDDRLTISDVWLVREWALSDARICFLEDIVSVYRQHGQQTTMATNTLRTLSDLMTTDVWVVAQRPEYYASTLAPRMDHCWWLRNQRKDLPHLVALLDILRSLIRARYVLATANWRAVGLVVNAVWTDLNETGRRLTTVVDSLTQRLASATGIPAPAEGAHATSFTFAEDAPGRPANIPPLDAKTMPAVREMVQLIYRAGLQVEQLIPLAELADTLVS